MTSDEELRDLKRKLEEVLGKRNAKTLMDLLIGEYRNEIDRFERFRPVALADRVPSKYRATLSPRIASLTER